MTDNLPAEVRGQIRKSALKLLAGSHAAKKERIKKTEKEKGRLSSE